MQVDAGRLVAVLYDAVPGGAGYPCQNDPLAPPRPLHFCATSWSEEQMSEREILQHCYKECCRADEILTLGGERFEWPILFSLALVHGVPTDAFTARVRRHAAWRFHDGPTETTTPGLVALPGLAELCAPLGIEFQPTEGEFLSHATAGKARVIATWLLDEFWRHGDDPERIRARRAMLMRWIDENAPDLSAVRPGLGSGRGADGAQTCAPSPHSGCGNRRHDIRPAHMPDARSVKSNRKS